MAQLVLPLASIALLVFTLIDVITIDSWRIRHLDKVTWAFIVILLPLIGAILWFVIGKERTVASSRVVASEPVVVGMDDLDDDIDAEVERQVEFHERQARIQRLEAELRAKRELPDGS